MFSRTCELFEHFLSTLEVRLHRLSMQLSSSSFPLFQYRLFSSYPPLVVCSSLIHLLNFVWNRCEAQQRSVYRVVCKGGEDLREG